MEIKKVISFLKQNGLFVTEENPVNREKNKLDEWVNEWKALASVIDRLFLYIFLVVIVVSSFIALYTITSH